MRILCFALCLTLLSPVLAHTAVKSVSPKAFARVTASPRLQVSLNEPINLLFSKVDVYPLDPALSEKTALNQAAADLLQRLLKQQKVPAPLTTSRPEKGQGSVLTAQLRQPLKPGPYVLVWRVVSADGHPVTGQSVFFVQ